VRERSADLFRRSCNILDALAALVDPDEQGFDLIS